MLGGTVGHRDGRQRPRKPREAGKRMAPETRAARFFLPIESAWSWFALGLAVTVIGFLIGPRIPADQQQKACVGNIELPGPFGIHLNCDSPEFLSLADSPQRLLEPLNYRQSRPGLIIAASLLQAPLSLISPALNTHPSLEQDPASIVESFRRNISAYVAYVILNAAILLSTFYFLRRIAQHIGLDGRDTAPILVSTGLLLVANDVSKAFFWSPHTQMFNILVPVIAVYAALRALEGALCDKRFVLAMGLGIGLGMTAYGAFLVTLVCILATGTLASVRESSWERRMQGMSNLAVLLMLAGLPSIVWYTFVRVTVGSFHSAELTEYAFRWMGELWSKGFDALLGRCLEIVAGLLAGAVPQMLSLFALLLFLVIIALMEPKAAASAWRQTAPSVIMGIGVSVVVLAFYTGVGWIFDRLAYPIIPSLVVAGGMFALALSRQIKNPNRQRVVTAGCVIIAVGNLLYEVIKDGPYS